MRRALSWPLLSHEGMDKELQADMLLRMAAACRSVPACGHVHSPAELQLTVGLWVLAVHSWQVLQKAQLELARQQQQEQQGLLLQLGRLGMKGASVVQVQA
jgi:NADPH-dependent curcumin reductase CurA